MTTFRRFEEIEAWQMARELTRIISEAANRGRFAHDYGLRDQIRRASVSVMANIAEGYERGGNKEFLQFLSMAKGSVGEVRSHLYIALDQGYLTQLEFDDLCSRSRMVSAKIHYLMESIRKASVTGPKYKPTAP